MIGLSFTPMLIISMALVFYSIGVWSERIQGRLKAWHLIFFWGGLVCDTWGTGLMIDMAGGLTSDIHGVSGVIAILLMLVHAFWATIVLMIRNQQAMINFHKFSLFVWIVWLIPYLSPMIIEIPGSALAD